jgi:hypothetical protein
METYLQTLWGDQWHYVTMDVVRTAIERIKEMDEEHAAFWVSVTKTDENVLEVHKDLQILGVFEDEPDIQYRGKCANWTEIESLYELLLSDKIEMVKASLQFDKRI